MKPEGLVFSFEFKEKSYRVFFPHDFVSIKCETQLLDIDGVIIFDENFVEIPIDMYDEMFALISTFLIL